MRFSKPAMDGKDLHFYNEKRPAMPDSGIHNRRVLCTFARQKYKALNALIDSDFNNWQMQYSKGVPSTSKRVVTFLNEPRIHGAGTRTNAIGIPMGKTHRLQ